MAIHWLPCAAAKHGTQSSTFQVNSMELAPTFYVSHNNMSPLHIKVGSSFFFFFFVMSPLNIKIVILEP